MSLADFIGEEHKRKFDYLFTQADSNNDGFVDGKKAFGFFNSFLFSFFILKGKEKIFSNFSMLNENNLIMNYPGYRKFNSFSLKSCIRLEFFCFSFFFFFLSFKKKYSISIFFKKKGGEAVAFLKNSQLPNEKLAKIW